MAQHTPPAAPSPDDMHWGISYLREDIQDLRQEVRAVHARLDMLGSVSNQRIDMVSETLGHRIDGVSETLTKRIDGVSETLTKRIDGVSETLTERIDGVSETLTERIDGVSETLTKRIDSRFALLLMAMVGLHGVTIGAIVAFLQYTGR